MFLQASYGTVPSTVASQPHGGIGGELRGPWILPEGSFIVKVAVSHSCIKVLKFTNNLQGLVNPNTNIQSLTFTNEKGQENAFGITGTNGIPFKSGPENCFLRYFSGSTTGYGQLNNFLNQITFNWCCPAA